MAFNEATDFFKDALMHVEMQEDPAMWHMLNGLIKLSESLQAMHSDLRSVASDVRNI